MKRLLLSLLFSFVTILFVYSQDTIKVMSYNLLNYGNYTSYCTTYNNNVETKNEYLRTIIDYTLPDILGVVEISPNGTYIEDFKNNVLNQNGRDYYCNAPKTNYSGSSIINMIYYDYRKVELKHWLALATDYRDINLYTFYFKNDALKNGDTVYLTCIVAHLKAGHTDSDAIGRTAMAQKIMDFLSTINENTNYLIMGDFNVYSSSEGAYQQFTNHANQNIRFYDFINKYGVWSDNAYFAPYHTQSTHTTSDCFSGGGLDDRFDFILGNINTITGQKGFKYVNDSYTTLGQDGQHFNKGLLDAPINTSAPMDVLEALYGNSDHLPVLAKFIIDHSQSIIDITLPIAYYIQNNQLYINIFDAFSSDASIYIYDVHGRILFSDQISNQTDQYTLDLNGLEKGIYLINIKTNDRFTSFKIVNI